jgi:SAM-dependent methyltransferase
LASLDPDELVAQQIAFYRADASSYEAWSREVFELGGGGAFGAACRRDRRAALAELAHLAPHGNALELAAGTGTYTASLLEAADHVTALDASGESLALARAKLAGCADRLRFIEADIFHWRPPRRYPTVFFAYWLSHVPSNRFESFWQLVDDALARDGRVFFIDSSGVQGNPGTPTGYRERDDLGNQVSRRELNGRAYQVVKVAWRLPDLALRLKELGWQARLTQGELSFWGLATRQESPPPAAGRW